MNEFKEKMIKKKEKDEEKNKNLVSDIQKELVKIQERYSKEA